MKDDFESVYTVNEGSKRIYNCLLPVLLVVIAIALAIHFSGGFTTGPLFAAGDGAESEFYAHYFL